MGFDLPSPSVWEWVLLAPSLCVLLAALGRGLAEEPPALPAAPWTLADLLIVTIVHLVAGAGTQIAFDVPFLPLRWAMGGGMVLANCVTCLLILAVTRRSWDALGLKVPRRVGNLAAVAVACVAFQLPVGFVQWAWMRLLQALGHTPVPQMPVQFYAEAQAFGDWPGVAILVVGAAFLAPLFEELFFRGFLFGLLRSRIGPAAGLLLASALFAAFHVSLDVFVPIFLVGAVLN